NVISGGERLIPSWSNSSAQTQGQAQNLESLSLPPKRPASHQGYRVIITALVVLLLAAVSVAGIFYYRSSNPGERTNNGQASSTSVSTIPPTPTGILYQADWSSGMNGWTGSEWRTSSGLLINTIISGTFFDFLATPPYQTGNIADYALEAQ